MVEEKMQQVGLEKITERKTKNLLPWRNQLISRKHEKVCTTLNYILKLFLF